MDDLSKSRTDLVRRWGIDYIEGCDGESQQALCLNLLCNPCTPKDLWLHCMRKHPQALLPSLQTAHLIRLSMQANPLDDKIVEVAAAQLLKDIYSPDPKVAESLRQLVRTVTDNDLPLTERLMQSWAQ